MACVAAMYISDQKSGNARRLGARIQVCGIRSAGHPAVAKTRQEQSIAGGSVQNSLAHDAQARKPVALAGFSGKIRIVTGMLTCDPRRLGKAWPLQDIRPCPRCAARRWLNSTCKQVAQPECRAWDTFPREGSSDTVALDWRTGRA